MSAFEDFVNTELPRRSALLTVENTGYDGDPNDGGAPAIFTGAPKGTWYLRETPVATYYRKAPDGDWEEGGGGGGGGGEDIGITRGEFTVPIDCENVSAVAVPSWAVFRTQEDVDDALGGAPAFKYLQQAWDALPAFVAHDIEFVLGAGTQFMDPSFTDPAYVGLYLDGKTLINGATFTMRGQPMSTWADIVAAQTITAHQAGNFDPWVQVSGTPFAGLDLRGQMAILDNGSYGIIMAHTDDTLQLGKYLVPAPVNGVTTVRVARPSTRIRNALETTPTTKHRTYLCSLNVVRADASSLFILQDVGLDYMGAVFGINTYSPNVYMNFVRVLIDHEYQRTQFGITPNGTDYQFAATGPWGAFVLLYDCSGYASDAYHSGRDNPMSIWQASVIAYGCYWGNAHGRFLLQEAARFAFTGGVMENLGTASSECVSLYPSADFKAERLSGFGRPYAIIRNIEGAGIRFGVRTKWAREDIEHLIFENVDGPLMQLLGKNIIDVSESGGTYGLTDGGGNGDVGIDIVGSHCIVHLNAGSDLSGAAGDMRVRGTIISYSDFEGLGPQDVLGLNTIEKEV